MSRSFKPQQNQEATASLELLAKNASVAEILALVKTRGVEECADLIRFVPPEKLLTVIDLDVWRNRSSRSIGRTEKFEAKRFLAWIEALLESGPDEAVEALTGMGLEFCSGALAHFLEPTPMEIYAMNRAESGLATEDKHVEHGRARELGVFAGSYVQTKSARTNPSLRRINHDDLSEIMSELLAGFETYAPEFLQGIFFHISRQVDDEVVIDDFQADRNLRLEQQGYIPARKASEHLLRFRKETGMINISGFSNNPSLLWSPEAWQEFVAETRTSPTALATLADINKRHSQSNAVEMLALWVANQGIPQRQNFQNHWYFLANLIATGWEHRAEKIGPRLSMKLLEATIELGMNLSLDNANSLPPPRSLLCLFERGWQYLYNQLALAAAKLLDGRLRTRIPENRELRESFFRFCSGNGITEYSVARWLVEGRYHRITDAIAAIEFGLTPKATRLLRWILDATPTLPLDEIQGTKTGGTKQVWAWVSAPGMEQRFLIALQAELADFSDPY
jgi:hypothetical protein